MVLFRIVGSGVLLTLLGGCGQLGLHRGLGGDGFADALRQCGGSPGSPVADGAVEACLTAHGWTVASWGHATAPPVPLQTPTAVAAAPSAPPPSAARHFSPAALSVTVGAPPPEAPTAPAEPVIHVASWWKTGGTVGDLDAAAGACAAHLAQPDGVDMNRRLVSPDMLNCLSDAGWHAIRADDAGALRLETIR